MAKVAVIYLSYHSEPYLADMADAFEKCTFAKEQMALVVVDNPHPQHGDSLKAINQIIEEKKLFLPETVVLAQKKNLGFCGGNNVGIKWAIEHGFDYVYLHNQDGFMAPDCLAKMVEALEKDHSIGCAQSLIMLYPETDKVNTAGNSFSFAGFGYISHFGKKLNEMSLKPVEQIGYASGSGLMLRCNMLKKFGFLDEDLFAYHEDVEYSLRLKMAGFVVALVRDSVFFHKYVFSRSKTKFYFMERNRYAVLLMYYKWPTLILFLPLMLVLELGLIFFFVINGWFGERLKIYSYWLKISNWKLWLQKRKNIQTLRVISDRHFLSLCTASVVFGEKKDMNHPLLIYIANPVLNVYKAIVQAIIFW